MKTIYLPAGTEYVQFDELAHKIAIALYPSDDSATEGESFAYFGVRDDLEAELRQAANSGALPVKDPLTFGPHSFPLGRALKKSLVSVSDLRVFLAGRPIAIESEPAQTAITPVPVGAGKRREKKPSIESVAFDYMRREYQSGQFQSAAKFHKHLIKTAGLDKSPFEMGTGTNARKLFCPAASSFFDQSTLGNMWAKIRAE